MFPASPQAAALDVAWLEAQYNNRAMIPEHPQIFASWASRSAAVRASHPCVLDVPFGPDADETLDIFPASPAAVPPGRKPPVLFFIHGGYWRSLDKADHSFLAPAFTERGITVVMPNYSLCPKVSIEEICMQMTRAAAWTHRHIGEHGGDSGHMVLAGHSAGGHLAVMLACCDWAQVGRNVGAALPARPFRVVVSLAGLFDLEPVSQVPFLQPELRLTRESARRLSPVHFPAPPVPVFTVAGALESDEFRRQTTLLRGVWGEQVVPVCEMVPATNHLTVLETLAQPGQLAFDWTLQQLR